MSSETHRGVEEGSTSKEHDESEARVVVPAEGLRPLEARERGVELIGVVRQGAPLAGGEPGGIERLKQRTAGRLDCGHRSPGTGSGGGGSNRIYPTENRHGGRDRAETDQDEEDSLAEGEPHRVAR